MLTLLKIWESATEKLQENILSGKLQQFKTSISDFLHNDVRFVDCWNSLNIFEIKQ